jgi:hypothetical protein
MCWVSVGNESSLYLNPRTGGTSPIEHGEWIADGVGGFARVKWRELDSFEVQNRKVSYHASGRVKGGAGMGKSVSVRDVERSTPIRQDDPSRFAVIEPEAMRTTAGELTDTG